MFVRLSDKEPIADHERLAVFVRAWAPRDVAVEEGATRDAYLEACLRDAEVDGDGDFYPQLSQRVAEEVWPQGEEESEERNGEVLRILRFLVANTSSSQRRGTLAQTSSASASTSPTSPAP